MKRRTRRSKLRGGRHCTKNEIKKMPGFQLRMHQHLQIIKDMMAVYDENPTSVFTQEVHNLMQEHCDDFFRRIEHCG